MARSKSSAVWLREHFNDEYVKKAQAEGLRSRAVYKLEELIERDHLLKPGINVVDLGAAPGSWSQLVRNRLGDSGKVSNCFRESALTITCAACARTSPA